MKKIKLRLAALSLTACLALSPLTVYASNVTAPVDSAITANLNLKPASTNANRQKITDFVTRMYSVCLGRTADAGGLNNWVNLLADRQATGASVSFGFIFSSEFQNKNCSNEEYVTYMYNAFFGRRPDPAGLADWVSQLDNGATREHVFSGFTNSAEFAALCDSYGVIRGDYIEGADWEQTAKVNLFVDRLYSSILNRRCDTAGMTDWTVKLIRREVTGAQVAYGFVFSQEFTTRHVANSDYVDVLYQAFMGRPADEAGRANWVAALQSGASREEVFNGFVGSAEFSEICNDYNIERGTANAVGETREDPEPTTPAAGANLANYVELDVPSTVVDSNDRDGELVIWSFYDDFQNLVDRYSSVSYDDFLITHNDGSAYTTLLDQVLASGENAPDLFACDAEYAKKYINSNNTIPVNNLGIRYSELSDMFDFTLKIGSDDNSIIKALTWDCCSCGVFYNRTVAQRTLGVSSPEDVAPYFANWDAFMDTARIVASAGNYRVVSGFDDVYRCQLAARTSGWVVDGAVNIDPVMTGFFDIAYTLVNDNLTWDTSMWSVAWMSNATNETVLSYWGPSWFSHSLELIDSENNPTSGDWGIVPGPTPWFWGGTWIMASKYCDKKSSVAQIMRDVCIDSDTLGLIGSNGAYRYYEDQGVNSVSIMRNMANSSDYSCDWLGGQNPYGIYLGVAQSIDGSIYQIYDDNNSVDVSINGSYVNCIWSYVHGDTSTVAEAEAEFRSEVISNGYANR